MLQDAAQATVSAMSASGGATYAVDLSPDFVFESHGRLTADGYEVESRIPFKTRRYQPRDPQDWGVNVIRRVQASGHTHTWTRVLQTNASFLAQGGTLTGLTGLRRGLVLDLNPEMTSSLSSPVGSMPSISPPIVAPIWRTSKCRYLNSLRRWRSAAR